MYVLAVMYAYVAKHPIKSPLTIDQWEEMCVFRFHLLNAFPHIDPINWISLCCDQ